MELSYSTDNITTSTPRKCWYVIRVTHNRTANVYKAIKELEWSQMEVYYPCISNAQFSLRGNDIQQASENMTPILPGFLFVNATEQDYIMLLGWGISGLTPYYNHFHENAFGKNLYLTIPDHQFENFRRYCEAEDNAHKIIDQKDMPSFLNGKKVRVISGPFKGVEGIVLRWHNMRRVFISLGDLATFGTGFIRSCDFELIQ